MKFDALVVASHYETRSLELLALLEPWPMLQNVTSVTEYCQSDRRNMLGKLVLDQGSRAHCVRCKSEMKLQIKENYKRNEGNAEKVKRKRKITQKNKMKTTEEKCIEK